MTYKTLAKICAVISFLSIAYMYVITLEGTYFGWIVFFVFLAFAILFNALDEQENEIAILRSPKEVKEIKEEKQETDPRSGDPFYVSDNFNPNYQKLMEEKKLKESNPSQNQNIKDSSKEVESESIFIPTYHKGMEKQWGSLPKKNNQPPQNNDEN